MTLNAGKYPGDTVHTMLFRDPMGELGDVRIQDYGDIGYRVGTFLPGVIECSPGDTPKVWPEKHEYIKCAKAALAKFEAYCAEAIAEGWRRWHP